MVDRYTVETIWRTLDSCCIRVTYAFSETKDGNLAEVMLTSSQPKQLKKFQIYVDKLLYILMIFLVFLQNYGNDAKFSFHIDC